MFITFPFILFYLSTSNIHRHFPTCKIQRECNPINPSDSNAAKPSLIIALQRLNAKHKTNCLTNQLITTS